MKGFMIFFAITQKVESAEITSLQIFLYLCDSCSLLKII